jgi:peptide/nickel transport system ATP-binding protein
MMNMIEVKGLRVTGGVAPDAVVEIVKGVDFTVKKGEVLALIGESGSGKTTIALSLLGHARSGCSISGGSVRVGELDVLSLDERGRRALRARTVAYVAQSASAGFNPARTIMDQVTEPALLHKLTTPAAAREKAIGLFRSLALPAPETIGARYPHQVSGGQLQRLMAAMALITDPAVVVFDEPTTALDVTTQIEVLAAFKKVIRELGTTAVYVSHDLAVVNQLADRVIVLYAGRIVESAPAARLFATPAHPYTKGLLAAIPDIAKASAPRPIPGQAPGPATRAPGCAFAPRCAWRGPACAAEPSLAPVADGHAAACVRPEARAAVATIRFVDLGKAAPEAEALLEVRHARAWYGARQVLFDAALSVAPGECVALVGESGSGKTTLARLLAGLGVGAQADVRYGRGVLALQVRERSAQQRREIQYIFQNPYRALNPRQSVGAILRQVLRHLEPEAADHETRIAGVLRQVALPERVLASYPAALSGGERQRVAIARALLCRPRLLICDEITSALDVSVQAAIIELLQQLQAGGLAILFVTHNLGVVRSLAGRVVVLRHGRVLEEGATDDVLLRPRHDYTRALVGDSPSILSFQPY